MRTLSDLMAAGSRYEQVVAGAFLYARGITTSRAAIPNGKVWKEAESKWSSLVEAVKSDQEYTDLKAEARALRLITKALRFSFVG